MVDYSKWDHIDISDDEGEDCHPNIDKQSWIKWKKEARQIKKKEDREAREKEDKLFQEEVKALDTLVKKKEPGKEEEEERLRKSIEAYKKRRENEAKYPVLEADNLREGFSKTIINKATPTTLDQLKAESSKKEKEKEKEKEVKEPKVEKETKVEKEKEKEVKVKKAEKTAEATSEDPEADGEEEEEEEENPKDAEEQRVVDEYVKQMEIKAHTFAASKTFEEYWEILKKHPDIMCSETHQYLLLHSSDFMKKGEDALSQHYLRAACIVNYCLELGKDGVTLFFHRMREPNPKWRMEFERDTLAYWHRIHEKYIELGKIKVDPAKEKAKAKAQAKPASIEDDLD